MKERLLTVEELRLVGNGVVRELFSLKIYTSQTVYTSVVDHGDTAKNKLKTIA